MTVSLRGNHRPISRAPSMSPGRPLLMRLGRSTLPWMFHVKHLQAPPRGSPTVGPATFHVKHRALSSLPQTGGPVLRPQTPPTQAHRSRSRHPQLPPPKDDANIPSHLERHPRPRPPHRRKQQEELLCTQMESPHHPRHSTHTVPHSTHPTNSPAHVLPAHIPSIAHHSPVLTRTPPRPRRRVPHGHPPPRARPPTQ